MDLETIAALLFVTAALAFLYVLRRLDAGYEGDDATAVIAAMLGAPAADPRPVPEPDEAVRWRLELLTPRATPRAPAPRAARPVQVGADGPVGARVAGL